MMKNVAWLLLLLSSELLSSSLTDAYKIAIVPKMTSAVGFYGLTQEGCHDRAAKADNLECVYNGTFMANVQGSLDIINELIDDPTIDGISVSVLDPDAYKPVFNRGIANGKAIITFDSDAPESDRLAYVGTDNYAMGRELAKLLRQIKPDGGTFGIVSGFGLNLKERVQGVRDVLATSKWIEVEDSPKNGFEDSHISLEKMWELVRQYPNLGAIVSVVGLPMFPENTTNWENFVDSNRDVLTVIADTLPVQLRLMQTSYVDALVGQLPYNMGYQSAETLLSVLEAVDEGTPLNETLPSEEIFGTHQLEVLRIPLQLPPVDFDYNYIGDVAIVGYVLCAIVTIASLAFTAWAWYYRTHQVVRSSQPMFLVMICIGTLLMGSAIIPLSIDDEKSQSAADVACMCSPWLINIGFTVAFSALFSKTWRLNKILLSKNSLKRVTVTEKDVMLPFVVLLTLNIIALICWTAIAPLKFVRTLEDGTDLWNRPNGSYGRCESTSGTAGDSIPYVLVIAVVNMTALVVANYQAYRARNVRTEFNESSYIFMSNASFLQAIFISVPILFLTRENPKAYFVVLSVVLFILSNAILVFIFVPKILTLRDRQKNGIKRESVRVSGMHFRTSQSSGSASRFGSSHNSAESSDPVTSLLHQYQALSWQDKTTVMKKLAPPSTRSIQDPEPVETSREGAKRLAWDDKPAVIEPPETSTANEKLASNNETGNSEDSPDPNQNATETQDETVSVMELGMDSSS